MKRLFQIIVVICGTLIWPAAAPSASAEDNRSGDKAALMNRIVQAWNDREQTVRSARFRFTETFLSPRGSILKPGQPAFENPRGATFPTTDMKYKIKCEYDFAGDRIRYRNAGPRPQPRAKGFVMRDYLSTYDGEVAMSLRQASGKRDFPQGTIYEESVPPMKSTLDIEPLNQVYRLLDPNLRLFDAERFVVASQEIEQNGVPCVLLVEKEGTKNPRIRRMLWVDPARDFHIVRFALKKRDGGFYRTVDFEYAPDKTFGWVPSGWKIVRDNGTGGGVAIDAKVTHYEINPEIPEGEFQIEFPDGTRIQDLRNHK